MNTKHLIIAALATAALTACSNIAEDERLIFVEHKDLDTDPDDALFASSVLVEDYTGQKCTWCPFGTRILEEQMALYGADRVIPVAIHSGPLGFRGTASATGLMSDLGVYYWDQNGFNSSTSQPTAVFDRRIVSGDRDAWGSHIYAELERHCTAGIEITSTLDSETATASITVTCHSLAAQDANLQLWLTESNIVAMQVDNGVTNREYVHNHVLRDAINGNDGESVSLSTTPTTQTYTYTLPATCVADNCEIVAFLYNESGVLQARKAPIYNEK